MDWLVETLRQNPAIAIFFTLGLGFLIGKWKYKSFSLGTVTSVLLVGVLVGQLDIPVGHTLKDVSFLLFLFAIGYSVGPQFFNALKGNGLKQVLFAVVMCALVFVCTWAVAKLFRYDVGEAAGLFSGAQTCSAIIGIADDNIRSLSAPDSQKQQWMQIVPVAYAVTYIFGTIGSAWILGSLGPMMLGGLEKVKKQTKELEVSMQADSSAVDPANINAWRPVVFRGYDVAGDFFETPKTVADVQDRFSADGKRVFVERILHGGTLTNHPDADARVTEGDRIVLSGRREFLVQAVPWIGPEISDEKLLSYPVEQIPVLVSKKVPSDFTVGTFRKAGWTEGVIIASLRHGNAFASLTDDTPIQKGDELRLTGNQADIKRVAAKLGYEDKPTVSTDMVFVGFAIVIGALIGALTLHIGRIPVSLSTSGGALISGLVFGWLRTKRPTFGYIPDSVVWLFNNLGLNFFIAVIGISAGPTFVSGLMQVGWQLLVAGVIVTTVPLILGILIGDKIFKFHPAITLGCVAGARTTTAALGAIQDSLKSTVPAMSYTVTYAFGNTLLILSGLLMVALM